MKNTCKTKTCKLFHSSAYQMTNKSGHQMLESLKYKKTHTRVKAIYQPSQPTASISHRDGSKIMRFMTLNEISSPN